MGAKTAPARAVEIALDPLRPLGDRIAATRTLDASHRHELETKLLASFPAIWSREMEHRLSMLAMVGSETTVAALNDYLKTGAVPETARVRTAIAETVAAIETRDRPEANPAVVPPDSSG